jgi:aldehyde dehydrogenase (NAD+)
MRRPRSAGRSQPRLLHCADAVFQRYAGHAHRQEEIFGPVATIIPYDSLDEAIEIANDTSYGLSACITGDPAKAADVVPALRAGMVAINNWGPTPGAPFGGYKQSGNGREGGLYGLKDFMEMKAISGLPA